MKLLRFSIPILILGVLVSPGQAAQTAPGKTFAVTSISDTVDANPGDGQCADSNGRCTLRAAIMEANDLAGADTISMPADTFLLTLTIQGVEEDAAIHGDLDITRKLTINGSGMDKTIIHADDLDRVFDIRSTGTATITGVTISGGSDGGLRNYGTLTLFENKVSNNNSTSFSGGVTNFGTLIIMNSFISSNKSKFASSGIENTGNLKLVDSTVNGNNTDGSGGGIGNYFDGELTLINSTISDNQAKQYGGGVYMKSGNLDAFNTTIVDNVANVDKDGSQNGGGIKHENGQVNLYNTILSQNKVHINGRRELLDDDCNGTLGVLRYSLLTTTTGCSFTNQNSITGKNAGLDSLADNGGPTQTHALLEGSLAIDAGDPDGCKDKDNVLLVTDQRGEHRSMDGDGDGTARCDIGAYEFVKFKSTIYLPILTK